MRSHTARCRSLSRPSLAHLSRVTVRGSVEAATRGAFFFFFRLLCGPKACRRPATPRPLESQISSQVGATNFSSFFLLLPCGLPEASARPVTPRPLQLRRVFLFVWFCFALWTSGRQPLDGLCEDFVGPPLSQPLRPPQPLVGTPSGGHSGLRSQACDCSLSLRFSTH